MASDLALDGLAEWMELGALPVMFDAHPERRELLGPGRTVRLTATDSTSTDATWFVDLRGEVMVHRPGTDEPAAVELRGPLTELLLVLYARRRIDTLEIVGDRDLLEFWHARVGFF